jgi:hypothetical protein
MKITHRIIDDKDVIVTPCKDCLFYSSQPKASCSLGRIDKYEELGKVLPLKGGDVEILTFCNHARPVTWRPKDETLNAATQRVIEDNKIKYSLIARIEAPEDVLKLRDFMARPTPPQKVIVSFEKIDIAEVIEHIDGLGCDFELIQIKDLDARAESELHRVDQPWSETVDLTGEFNLDIIEQLDHRINSNLEQIVAVVGEQYVVMTMLVASIETAGIKFDFNNLEEIAKIQGTYQNIRRFDGERICDYS